VLIKDHNRIARKIGEFLNEMLQGEGKREITKALKDAWEDLQRSKPDILKFDKIWNYVLQVLENEEINIQAMNSKNPYKINIDKGLNITVGGNSLGRGVTFPQLQTVYYCRTAKTPQADTYWQHCRMFGYDRDPGLARVYLPPYLLKLFTDLNNSNRALIAQVDDKGVDNISLLYPPKVKPTRRNVIDKTALDMVVGGVNMFASYPSKNGLRTLDIMLSDYAYKGINEIKIDQMIEILKQVTSEKSDDWNNLVFINCLKALNADGNISDGVLILRKNRDLKREPRTMLSPDDRKLGNNITDRPVLTLYRINGNGRGWDKDPGPRWMPNIKLPQRKVFYKICQ
jgi:hypothetical protein